MRKEMKDTNTAVLQDLGIKPNDKSWFDVNKIRGSEEAFTLFVNLVKSRDDEYLKVKNELKRCERLAENRKFATIIMTVAELVLAIGTGGIFSVSEYRMLFGIIIAVGVLLTCIALYFSFADKDD